MTLSEKEIYEKKKEIVLSSLESLRSHWYLAESLFENIVNEGDNPELIDAIIDMFEIAVDAVKDEDNRLKIRETLDSINALKEKESKERKDEANEANLVLENF